MTISSASPDEAAPAAPGGRPSAWAPGLVLAFYAVAILIVGSRHEAWIDEAQAWLVARDATPWEIVTRYARYEGTPPLWHLLLWAAAELGYPYRWLWLISSALALAGAAVVLFRAPFPLAMRCAVVLGYYFAYQYPVVARSYALDLVLIPLLATLHARRLDRPLAYGGLLGVLACANTHSFLIAGVLGLDYAAAAWRSRRWTEPRVLGGAALAGALALFALAAAWPPGDIGVPFDPVSTTKALQAAMVMAEAFIDRADVWSAAEPSILARLLGLIASMVVLLPSLGLFTLGRVKAVFLGACGLFFAFTLLKYGKGWHAGVLFLVWIFALWVSWPHRGALARRERIGLTVSLCAILGLQVFYTTAAWSREVRQVYGPGAQVAAMVDDYRADHPQAKTAAFGFYSFVAQPFADANLFDNFEGARPGAAFYDWRASQPLKPYADLAAWTEAVGRREAEILLLANVDGDRRGPFEAVAARGGYCGRLVDGRLIWKTYNAEPLGVSVFLPCGR